MLTTLFAAALTAAIFFGAVHGRPATHGGTAVITAYDGGDTISSGGPPGAPHP